jgi:hypothetical protein
MTIRMTRREFAAAGGAAGAALLARPVLAQPLLTRAIPSTGERLPAVGLGTAQVFNTNARRPCREMIRGRARRPRKALIVSNSDGPLIWLSDTYDSTRKGRTEKSPQNWPRIVDITFFVVNVFPVTC